MPDSYENAKFLNEEDKALMRLRTIKYDRYMRVNETFDKGEVLKAFRDKKLWLGASIQFFGDILSFGISTFLPSLVKSFKFDSVLTQLLTVPIYFWAVSIYITVSFLSDRFQKRAFFMIPGALAVIVGYAMLCGIPMRLRGVLYFACFIIVPGVYVSEVVSILRSQTDLLVYAGPQLCMDVEQPCGLLQTRHRDRCQYDSRELCGTGDRTNIQKRDGRRPIYPGRSHFPRCRMCLYYPDHDPLFLQKETESH